MNTRKCPIYHKSINLEKITEVEAPRDRRKVLAIGVSESGHLAMNERFLSMVQRFLKGNAEEFGDDFKSVIGSSAARKEVWIATSGLSLSKLDQELMKDSPQRELLPMIHLLHSTEDVFTGIGARLKVLCKA